MNLKKMLAVVMTFMLVFVSMSFGSVVYAESAVVGEVAMVLTTNNECPTGPTDPDILKTKPAVNSVFYLWVLTSPVNELVGAETWVTFDSSKFDVVDMDSSTTGIQPVFVPATSNPHEVSVFEVTAGTLNSVDLGTTGIGTIKYAASNTVPSNYTNGAVLLKTKFTVKAEIPDGTKFNYAKTELRGKLGLDNNPIKIIPTNLYAYGWGVVPTEPQPPLGGTVDDIANTYTFIPNLDYPLSTDYEYSLDSGLTWSPCVSFIINVGNIALPASAVQVRVKADTSTGRPAGIAQMSDLPYTVSAQPAVPAAPTAGVVDDIANTFTFTVNPLYPVFSDYEYSINNGANWLPCTSTSVNVGNIALPVGAVQVRVKAIVTPARPAGLALVSTNAFTVAASGLTAALALDSPAYGRGSEVQVNLNLSGVIAGDKTNSVAFEIVYDTTAFELATSNPENDIVNTYIPYVDKRVETIDATHSKLVVTYVGFTDVILINNSSVLTARFRVKDTAEFGVKNFNLLPISMIDSDMNIHVVNNNLVSVSSVEISDLGYVEGYFEVYLGNVGTGLFTNNFNNLNQQALNKALASLSFTLSNSSGTNQIFTGTQVILLNQNGDFAEKNATTNKVIGRFRIPVSNVTLNTLTISGDSYLKRIIGNVNVVVNQTYLINNANTPIILYPGDLGQLLNGKVTSIPDGQLTNIDFSTWLRVYKNQSTATSIELQMADINKDGVISNIDFSTWLSSYKVPIK